MPPESWCGYEVRNSSSPAILTSLSTFSSIPSVLCIMRRLKDTFCSTVSQGKSVGFWKTMPRSGAGPVIGLPSSVSVPVVGAISPAMRRSIVDLPQPDAPTMLMNSPVRTSRLTS